MSADTKAVTAVLLDEAGDSKEKKVEWFEDILEGVGGGGKFQKLLVAFIFASCVAMWVATQNHLYVLYVPRHWCHVPGRGATNFTVEEWKALTLPTRDGTYSQCEMFSAADNATVSCQHGWDYDDAWFSSTIPSDHNWVCDKNLYMNNALAISQGLATVAVIFVSYSGDRFGRRFEFAFSVALVAFGRFFSAFSPSIYVLYVFLIFIGSSGNGPSCCSIMSLGLELTDAKSRSFVNTLAMSSAIVGCVLCAVLAWILRNYFHILLASTTPLFVVLCFLRWIPESPRWLISKGRYHEAFEVLQRIARTNGKELPPETLEALEHLSERRSTKLGIMSLIKHRTLRNNTLLLVVSRFVTTLTCSSVTYNVMNIAVNPFVMHIAFSVMDIPSMIMAHFLGQRCGRRLSHCLLLGVASVASLVLLILQSVPSSSVAEACVSVVLEMVSQSALVISCLQSMEIHPTCVRQTAGAVEMFTMTAAFTLSPYMVYMHSTVGGTAFYGLLATLLILTTVAVSFLPETINRKLPETLEDADKFGTEQSFWKLIPRRYK